MYVYEYIWAFCFLFFAYIHCVIEFNIYIMSLNVRNTYIHDGMELKCRTNYMHIYVYKYIWASIHIRICVYVLMNIYIFTCKYMHMRASSLVHCVPVGLICPWIQMPIQLYIYVCIWVYMSFCIYSLSHWIQHIHYVIECKKNIYAWWDGIQMPFQLRVHYVQNICQYI